MGVELSDLPEELLTAIFEQVSCDQAYPRTLRALCLTSSLFRRVAQPVLYRDISLRNGLQCLQLDETLQHRKDLRSAIRKIYWPDEPGHDYGLDRLAKLLRWDLRLRELHLHSRQIMCVCNKSTMENWHIVKSQLDAALNDAYFWPRSHDLFHRQAAPLQWLRRLTLSWMGKEGRLSDVSSAFAGIFGHPTVEELIISHACIGDAAANIAEDLEPKASTPLKSLALHNCNVSVNGFKAVMAMPSALEHLEIREYVSCERHAEEHFIDAPGWVNVCVPNEAGFLEALRQQQKSLKGLICWPRDDPEMEQQTPDLEGFAAFTRLKTVVVHDPCPWLESRLCSAMTAPPNLEALALNDSIGFDSFEDNYDHVSNDPFGRFELMHQARGIGNPTSLRLLKLNVGMEEFFGSPIDNNGLHLWSLKKILVEKVSSILGAKNVRLIVVVDSPFEWGTFKPHGGAPAYDSLREPRWGPETDEVERMHEEAWQL